MAIENFLKVLSRHKITLVIIPVIAIIITYFLVRNLPDSYASRSRIATGIIDGSGALMKEKNLQESQVSQQFNNIIQTMMLKKVLNQVSCKLAIHDFTSNDPFRKPGKLWQSLSTPEKKHAIEIYESKYSDIKELSLSNPEENRLLRLLASMKYDNESLLANLLIFRVNNSDFIDLNYEAENPLLSAFVLNTLCRETIAYYTATVNDNNRKSIEFLDSLLQHKQAVLNQKMQGLRDYKIKNGILDVNGQASTLIARIADFETKKQDAEKSISSYKGALKNIDNRFNPNDRKFFESSAAKLNQDILVTKNRLNVINTEYLKSNFNPVYKAKVDSLQSVLSSQINRVNDNDTYNPASSKQELISQKLNLEVSLELAKNSVSSLTNELNRLNNKLYTLVPNQAAIKQIQDEIDLATTEYTELSKKYEQARMDANFTVKLRQVEIALPGTPKPSKKMLLVILSGVISFTFCIAILFIFFLLDNSITDSKQLANRTNQPVIGSISLLNSNKLNLDELWRGKNDTAELQYFKNLIRNIRFELDNSSEAAKVVAVTSLRDNEGKTFFALNLAYAYKMINQKILLIDGNFDDSTITQLVKPQVYLEDFLISNDDSTLNNGNNDIVVMGNKGGNLSLLEICNQTQIGDKLKSLRRMFDVILIETPALNKLNKAKEWMIFADKVVPVFEASQTLTANDNIQIDYLNNLNGKLSGWVLNKVIDNKGIRVNSKKTKTVSA